MPTNDELRQHELHCGPIVSHGTSRRNRHALVVWRLEICTSHALISRTSQMWTSDSSTKLLTRLLIALSIMLGTDKTIQNPQQPVHTSAMSHKKSSKKTQNNNNNTDAKAESNQTQLTTAYHCQRFGMDQPFLRHHGQLKKCQNALKQCKMLRFAKSDDGNQFNL